MKESTTDIQFFKEDIFASFKLQLQKDFESSGLDSQFIIHLSQDFETLRITLQNQLKPLLDNNKNALMTLLYRVDISKEQLNKHQQNNPDLKLEQQLSELIIKRILQKVILKRTFKK